MTKEPLISVIVPFYNIEGCVDYCMKSILNQTYRDFEIICVDDGSTDATGRKLDEYQSFDKVTVLHKSNGGLSDARNYGVKHARGELVSFVDGDDVVSPWYLEALTACSADAPGRMVIGQSRYISESEARNGSVPWHKPEKPRLVEKREVLEKYAYEEILPGAWCRCAPRELYEKIPFPKGAYYEEIATAAGFVTSAEEVAVVDEPLYGYVMRAGSIVHRKTARFKQVEDYVAAIAAFEDAIDGFIARGGDEPRYFRCLHYSRIFRLLDVVTDAGGECGGLQSEISRTIRGELKQLLSDERAPRGNKARFLILGLTPWAYCRCFALYDKVRAARSASAIES